MEAMGFSDQKEKNLNSAEAPEAVESESVEISESPSAEAESTDSELEATAEEQVTPASGESTDPDPSEAELADPELDTSSEEIEELETVEVSAAALAEAELIDSQSETALEEQEELELEEPSDEGPVEDEPPEADLESKVKQLAEIESGESPDDEESSDSKTEDLEQAPLPVQETEPSTTESDLSDVSLDFLDEDQSDTTAGEEDDRAWYVVHCYSGYENKVRHNLEQRIETMGMKDQIFDIIVPTEEEIEVREGKRRTIERRVFPGYILVNMVMTEESWYVVRNTPGVTGFVGMGNTPTPLRPEEVSQIIKRMEAEAPRIKVTFKSGERVRIVDGPFNDFRGTVAEIDMERAKVRVMVNFFGRDTPVELDFLQVEKT
jgi:transcriptional antiterminator NusG